MLSRHSSSIALLLALPAALAACDTQEPVDDIGEEAAETSDETGEAEDTGDETGEAEEIGDETGEAGDEPEPEPCDMYAAMRECVDGQGTQFCYGSYLDLRWGPCLTAFECMPGDTRVCSVDEEGQPISQPCVLPDGVPSWDEAACETPLVVSFTGGPIQTISSAATFDISGFGECLSTDWPTVQNPWLAIDLDGNGFVDGGHELFGSGSILESGVHAKNGFIALAALDSNHDGRISAADVRFTELLLWRDDGDKLSMPAELSTLADEGVLSIALDVEIHEQCDERGNCGRERSRLEFVNGTGGLEVGEVVDLYLACQ